MLNRLLWLSLGILIFVFTLFKFSYKGFLSSKKKKNVKEDNDLIASTETISVVQEFSEKAQRQNLWSLSKIEFLSIVKEPVFLVLIIIGVIVAGFITYQNNQYNGTPSLPLTRFMVAYISGGIALFSTIILIIYSGEAVHRTRSNKTFEFYDALPVSNTTLYLSKIISLIGVAVLLTLINILVGIMYQTGNGYFDYELGMYLTYNFTTLFPLYVSTLLLAFFIHVLVNNKFLGHFIVIIIYVGIPILVGLVLKNK
eukprot:TRINITY_DN102_c0_g1_i10.p1 TRINITY_DN102_c0_g1~~TRINITY_DN102_c0_g1_i10.p1  ORF type:complete len:255 (+),score=44.31 TRINITY_DN102_c0_g1_i10:701-1465(+)